MHSGNFMQGQAGATYTVTVSNAASTGPTSGTVTVTETMPSGLSLASMAGTGWTCPAGGTTCSRSDALAGGASYPAIAVTVNVATNATSPLVNTVSVSGGGSATASASDSTTILPPSVSTVCTPSTLGFTYTIGGTTPPAITCTVTTSPSGLSLFLSTTGGSWLLASLSGNVSPAMLTISVNPTGLAPGVYSGAVTLSGAFPSGAPAFGPLALPLSLQVVKPAPVLTISKMHTGNFSQGQTGANYGVAVSNAATAGPTTGAVTVTEAIPPGLTLVSMAGTGWTCPAGGNTCTRSDALAAGSSYAPIAVTVNVASNASSPQVNQVSVSGGGSATANATDSTTITQAGHPAFFAGEVALGSGVYYLALPDGSLFGYYTYTGGGWIYHFDMGYEDVVPASSGNGVYLWDLASGHWWYTNSGTFPYLYDFTLKAWIYYFPAANNAGHYTTTPRYFVNTTTGVIFTL